MRREYPLYIGNTAVKTKEKKYYTENCLLDQPLVMDEDITIKELISNAVLKLGENITIKRFARYQIGS